MTIDWILPTFEADDWNEAVVSENGTIWTNNQSDTEIFCRRANENFTTIQDNGKSSREILNDYKVIYL